MKRNKLNLKNTLLFSFALSLFTLSTGFCQTFPQVELRLAAHPELDENIAHITREAKTDKVIQNESKVAKWVPIHEKFLQTEDFKQHKSRLEVRQSQDVKELLVLVGKNDITPDHVKSIERSTDRSGNLALRIILNENGKDMIQALTSSSTAGRQYPYLIAAIIDGKVLYIVPVVSQVYQNPHIKLPPSLTEKELLGLLGSAKESVIQPPFSPVLIVNWYRVTIFGVLLVLGFFACLPAHDLPKPKYTKISVIIGAVIAGLALAYILGVTQAAPEQPYENTSAIVVKTINVSLANLALGALIGAVCGAPLGYLAYRMLRRSWHNFNKTVHRVKYQFNHIIGVIRPSGFSLNIRGFPKVSVGLNHKQRCTLITGICLIGIAILFPPWLGSRTRLVSGTPPEGYTVENYRFVGFQFIGSSEELRHATGSIVTKIYYPLLLVIITAICCLTFIAVGIFRNKKKTILISAKESE